MKKKPKPATNISKTPNFNFIFGSYAMSSRVIPYFQITLDFQDAARYLTLVDNLPGASSMDWRIEELFQRDIEWNRVERGIIPFLSDNDRPHFFNSLSIALIPRQGSLLRGFDNSLDWLAPRLDNEDDFEANAIKSFGPIRCGYWEKWDHPQDEAAAFGQLTWNIDQIAAVAIDGQHRLAAIKELVRTSQQQNLNASVPAILLVFDPQLGYTGPTDYESTLTTMRRLFIDLNKHARTVNRARRILLDDKEPVSICVRSIVGKQLTEGETELTQDPPCLPLTLVDWHSEQAKFEEGPYLTTILGLDWIVSQLLSVKPMDDAIDYSRIYKNLKQITKRTGAPLAEAYNRLKEAEKLERPFSFLDGDDGGPNELAVIADHFSSTWSAAIIHLLTELTPYAKLVKARRNSQTLNPQFANWNALRSREKATTGKIKNLSSQLSDLERELQNHPTNPISTNDFEDGLDKFETIKRTAKIAFTVVFQRALFIAFGRLVSISDNMISSLISSNNQPPSNDTLDQVIQDEFDDDDTIQPDEREAATSENEVASKPRAARRAKEFIDALNTLYAKEPQFYSPHLILSNDENDRADRFWNASLTFADATMDYSQAASKRASELLFSLGLLYIVRRNSTIIDFDDLVKEMHGATSGPLLKLRNSIGVMASDNHIADMILKNREVPEAKRTEEARLELIMPRIQALWKACK